MDYQFRKAELTDLQIIWRILKEAIIRRKEDGSNQWQDGYPNEEVIKNDLHNNYGYVLTSNKNVIGYCALIKNNEQEDPQPFVAERMDIKPSLTLESKALFRRLNPSIYFLSYLKWIKNPNTIWPTPKPIIQNNRPEPIKYEAVIPSKSSKYPRYSNSK